MDPISTPQDLARWILATVPEDEATHGLRIRAAIVLYQQLHEMSCPLRSIPTAPQNPVSPVSPAWPESPWGPWCPPVITSGTAG